MLFERDSKPQANFSIYLFTLIREILHLIQTMEPPGRFLLKNYSTYEWDVVSTNVAREKVCQVSVCLFCESPLGLAKSKKNVQLMFLGASRCCER